MTNLQFWNPGVFTALRKVSWDRSITVLRIKWISARTDTQPVKYTRDEAPECKFKAVNQMPSLPCPSLTGFLPAEIKVLRNLTPSGPLSPLSFPPHSLPLPGFHQVAPCTSLKLLTYFPPVSHLTWSYTSCSYVCWFVSLLFSLLLQVRHLMLFTTVTLAPNKHLLTQK